MEKSGKIFIDSSLCKGCNICIDFCPREALTVGSKFNKKGTFFPIVDEDKCNVCGICTLYCPDFAIFKEDSKLATKET